MKGLIFTLLLTYGGAVASLFRPFFGLLIYICFAVIKPEALWPWAVPEGNYSRIVFIALAVGWAFAGFGTWRFGRARLIAVLLCFYEFWVVVSALGAPDQELAWAIVEENAKIVLPVIVGLSLVDSIEKLKQIAWVIVISHGFLALEFNISYYEGFNRLVAVGFAGMEEKTVALTMVVTAGATMFFALNTRSLLLRGIAILSTILMIHVPLFTFSRSGMLALVGSGLTAVWLVPKKPKHIAVVLCVVLLGFRLAGSEVREQFNTTFASEDERDASAQSRLTLWAQAWETTLQHPLTGIGPRHWGAFAEANYDWGSAKEVHNTWFQTAAELGLPGVAALALFFVVTVLRLLPLARGRVPGVTTDEMDLSRAVVVSLAGFAVASQFITVYGIEVPYYIALIGAGVLKLRAAQPVRNSVEEQALSYYPAFGVPSAQARPSLQRPHGRSTYAGRESTG
jgi:O-antigen ligase